MAVNIHNLIAAISPDTYCQKYIEKDGERIDLVKKVKDIVKENKDNMGYLSAAKESKPKDAAWMDFYDAALVNAFKNPGLKNPIEKHILGYDTMSEGLEPLYFWIIDTLKELLPRGKVDKLVDNFIASPGSAHFSEMGQRATRMQEEAMKILGTANTLIKSILNIIYDLKEFDMRLKLYKELGSSKKESVEAARLALKQLWLDSVDIKKGNTSIKAMAQQFDYVTLIDAFMMVEDETLRLPGKDEELDLNDRVKRIVRQRIAEFNYWLKVSEAELKKRYEIEKIYLKSQVTSVKLYARWVKPYLKAAKALEQNASPSASLVTAFNTALFELVLLGQGEYDPEDDIKKGDLPRMVRTSKKRKYFPIIIVEINFRSIPERVGQSSGYGFRGKAEATFTSYSLNEDEIKVLKQELDKDDLNDMLGYLENLTDNSLAQIQQDIDELLGEKKEEKEEENKESEDTNPFSALFDFFKTDKKKDDKKKDFSKGIPPDSEVEKAVRSQAILSARFFCRKIYDTYKKSHSMPAFHPN